MYRDERSTPRRLSNQLKRHEARGRASTFQVHTLFVIYCIVKLAHVGSPTSLSGLLAFSITLSPRFMALRGFVYISMVITRDSGKVVKVLEKLKRTCCGRGAQMWK